MIMKKYLIQQCNEGKIDTIDCISIKTNQLISITVGGQEHDYRKNHND